MMTGELNVQEMTNVLCSQSIGRLACADGRYPYIIPIMYLFEGNAIIAQSLEGKKIDIMRRNPNVCFQVDMILDLNTWQSVIVHGLYQEMEGLEADEAREALVDNIVPLMTTNRVHSHEHEVTGNQVLEDDNRIKNILFKIRVNEMTGRFSKL